MGEGVWGCGFTSKWLVGEGGSSFDDTKETDNIVGDTTGGSPPQEVKPPQPQSEPFVSRSYLSS